MNSTVDIQAMATTSQIARQSPKGAGIATRELNSHLNHQAEANAPEASEKVRSSMREVIQTAAQDFLDIAQMLLEQAFSAGRQLSEKQQLLKKGRTKFEYKAYLGQIGWTTIKANKYIRLVYRFGDFGAARLKGITLETLFTLCAKKYDAVVEKMRDLPHLTQVIIDDLIKEARPHTSTKPTSSWRRDPSGGGRHYAVNLYHEEAAIAVEEQAATEGVLPGKIIAEAVLMRQKAIHNQTLQQKQCKEEKLWLEIDTDKLKSCESWSEVESTVNCDRTRFAKIVKNWTEKDKQQLISMLAAQLDRKPEHLRSLTWIPVQLLLKGLFASSLEKKLFPPTPKYDPYPRGAVGARKNWEALQAMQQQGLLT